MKTIAGFEAPTHTPAASRISAAFRTFSRAAALGTLLFSPLLIAAPGQAQATRDPFLWPFSQGSIWNQPLGSSADYHEIDLPTLGACRVDVEFLAQTTSDDPTYNWQDTYYGPANYPVVMPKDLVVNSVTGQNSNNCVSIVQPDGRVYEADDATRDADSDLTGAIVGFDNFQQFAITNVTGDGTYGAHLGSGLSTLGGSIRAWELQSDDDYIIRHAVKLELDQHLYWRNPNDDRQSFVWPADRNDGPNQFEYGVYKDDPALAPGSLLALKPDATIDGLGIKTAAGRKLFHALQDYGAYVVDASGTNYKYGDHDFIANICEEQPAVGVFNMACNENDGGDFYNDLNAMYTNLYVIDNNAAGSIGGGGTARRDLAPPFNP